MLSIIIGVFIALVVLGAIADSLLSEKAKTDRNLAFFLAAIPSPYNIMRLYAQSGDNLNDFTRAHAVSGMGYLGVMLIVAAFAWWADQQVLYGMELVSSRDPVYSWWQSVGIATIIQALLVFNGGMAIKLKINKMLDDSDHLVQFRIHLLLSCIALVATGYLSTQTDSIAEAKGMEAQKVKQMELEEERDKKQNSYNGQIAELQRIYSTDSAKISNDYLEAVGAARGVFLADSTRKANDGKRGVNSSAYVEARIARFRKDFSKVKVKAGKEKRAAFDSLHARIGSQIDELQSGKTEHLKQWSKDLKKSKMELQDDIDYNAGATRYKNLALNIIALFLNLGLQFFNRGAIKTERRKRLEKMDDQDDGDIQTGGTTQAGSGDGNTKGTMQGGDPVLDSSDAGKNVKKMAKGGTVQANMGIDAKEMPGGEIVVLYRGTQREEWWNWSKCRAALKNRVNKFNKAKSDSSRETQLAWIKLIEDKMAYIENHQSGGRKLPGRKKFNPKRPSLELFTN